MKTDFDPNFAVIRTEKGQIRVQNNLMDALDLKPSDYMNLTLRDLLELANKHGYVLRLGAVRPAENGVQAGVTLRLDTELGAIEPKGE